MLRIPSGKTSSTDQTSQVFESSAADLVAPVLKATTSRLGGRYSAITRVSESSSEPWKPLYRHAAEHDSLLLGGLQDFLRPYPIKYPGPTRSHEFWDSSAEYWDRLCGCWADGNELLQGRKPPQFVTAGFFDVALNFRQRRLAR